jgi:MinD superfamily P-loop ATPase
MKQLVILSGKGGAGKTTVTAALTSLAARQVAVVLADTDVDASNLELLLAPVVREEHVFMAGQVAEIDAGQCKSCGTCQEVCRFDAIEPPAEARPSDAYRIDAIACEGCAACFHACPTESIHMQPIQAGIWFRSDTRFGPLLHARLLAGRENSGKLVTLVKQKACELARKRNAPLILIDGPPGIGCPVISAISGADLALLVAEPTITGEHDLERALAVTAHFGVPAAVVINKADLNPARAEAIESFCLDREMPVLGRVPYDTAVDESIIMGVPLTEYKDNALTEALERIWHRLRDSLLEPGIRLPQAAEGF